VTSLALEIAPRERPLSRAAYNAAVVVAGSLVVAGLAQIKIHLGFTPVPITGQTLGVLLVGASLGPGLGAASLLLYIGEGAVGLPFFAGGAHFAHGLVFPVCTSDGASAGYLWGFVAAAGVVGWLSRLGWDRRLATAIAAMFIGEIILYAGGIPWLDAACGLPAQKGLSLGLYPFVIGDTIKLLFAAGLLPTAWGLLRRFSPERRAGSA
jgi:biotin transport system substrate-specific component